MSQGLKETLRAFVLPRVFVDDWGSPVHLPKAVAAVEKLLTPRQPTPPSQIDLDVTYNHLKNAWKRGTPLSSMDKKHLKTAPWVIFDTRRSPVLAADVSFSKEYFHWLRTRKSTSTISCLVFSFLKEYPKQIPSFNLWRQALNSLLESSNSLRLQRWLDAAAQFYLLEDEGPQRFAEIVLNEEEPLEGILRSANLEGELENQGFSGAAYVEGLNMVESLLANGSLGMKELDRLIHWSRRDGSSDALRYPNEKARLAESLLRPFARRVAPQEMKKKIKTFLLSHLGDPRFQVHHWFGVSEHSVQVMRSWMIEASLEYFFRVLDHTADPIWRYRKAFWRAFFDRGHIHEAWPILGRSARMAINRAARDTEEEVPHGTLRGGVAANQSVLLLVIAGLLIAEWSHNGKCRVWNLESATAQALKSRWFYSTRDPVSGEELRRSADFEVVHNGSASGAWQNRLYEYIHEHTGIQIPRSLLMPRRI